MQTVIASLLLLLPGCDPQIPPWNAGKLVVIVPEADLWPESEFQRELARMFAERLNASLELIPLPQTEIPDALRKHFAHFAAVPFRKESNPAGLQFGPAYQSVREVLVCNRDIPRINSLADLKGKEVMVAAGSAHETALREAQRMNPSLQWITERDLTTQDLLAEVGDGSLDCAAANELQFADARNYHPDLVAELDIVPPSNLAWAFPGNADSALLDKVQDFFTAIQQDGTLHRLLDRYYGNNNRLDKMDAAAFITRTKNVLPRFRHMFDEAATLTGIDWRLLAALSYQESQWDPLATSYTNVRGMMMLTEDTADQMKVGNRLNPRESITCRREISAAAQGTTAQAHSRTRPHLDGTGRLQPGLQSPGRRAHPDQARRNEPGQLGGRETMDAAAEPAEILQKTEARLCARRRGGDPGGKHPQLLRDAETAGTREDRSGAGSFISTGRADVDAALAALSRPSLHSPALS